METEEFKKNCNVQVHAVSCPDVDAMSLDLRDNSTLFLRDDEGLKKKGIWQFSIIKKEFDLLQMPWEYFLQPQWVPWPH